MDKGEKLTISETLQQDVVTGRDRGQGFGTLGTGSIPVTADRELILKTHSHTHTGAHTTHWGTHIHTHTHALTHTNTHTGAHTHTHWGTHTHTHTHTLIYTPAELI